MVYCQCRGADVRWAYHPSVDVHFLMGPWVAPDGRIDYKSERQHAHIKVGAGLTYWACYRDTEPIRFGNLQEAKAYLLALVRLT
jgi:hypothetical protein